MANVMSTSRVRPRSTTTVFEDFPRSGCDQDQPITVGATRYTLQDLGEGAKAIFRCDPKDLYRYDKDLVHEHLPWGLIAFSILIPPSAPTWTNAYGETINLITGCR